MNPVLEEALQGQGSEAPEVAVVPVHRLQEGHHQDHHVPAHAAEVAEGRAHLVHVLEHRVVEDDVEAALEVLGQGLLEVEEDLARGALQSAGVGLVVGQGVGARPW